MADDLQPLLEAGEALGHRQQVPAVVGVLAFLPAGPQAQHQAPAGEVIHRRRHAGRHGRVAEGERRDQRAELDAAGVAGQPGERDPQFQRILIGRLGVGVVVGAVEAGEAQLFDGARQALPAGPVEPVLALDHHRNIHPFLSSSGAGVGRALVWAMCWSA